MTSKRDQMRGRIAQTAARLMAEHGIADFGFAKRKAARQLGAPDSASLPSNVEVEEALRTYQSLFQADTHASRLRELRESALRHMARFERFSPRLTGSVLSGTAGEHADINIELFADNEKEVELFLLANGMTYQAGGKPAATPQGRVTVPVFVLEDDVARVELAVLAPEALRNAPRQDGRAQIRRASIAQVKSLLEMMPEPGTPGLQGEP
jgi:hypothetical protein